MVDAAIFVAFLIAGAPKLSGLAVHEWLGVALGAGILTHLLLHWQWIVGITQKFFGRVSGMARLNYLLNLALFIDVVVLIFSGLAISKIAMPTLGVQLAEGGAWKMLHHTTADAAVMMVGLHVALHWSWIVKTGKKYLVSPIVARVAGERSINQPAAALNLTAHKEA
jgi:hypothetical protein